MRALVGWVGGRVRPVVLAVVVAACAGERAGERAGAEARRPAGESASAARTVTTGPAAGKAPAAGPASGVRVAGGPVSVLFVGTSLTAGYGLDSGDAYPTILQRLADSAGLRAEMRNHGLSGETSAGALRRIDWLLREPPDVLVLETGANDGLRGVSVDAARANIDAILTRVRERSPSTHVLLVPMEAPPNLGLDYTARFREMFPALARKHGATLTPFLLDGVAGVAALNQGDGIHPNPQGARRVAATLWPAVRAAVERVAAGPAGQGTPSGAGAGGGR